MMELVEKMNEREASSRTTCDKIRIIMKRTGKTFISNLKDENK
jgi:hypothetical protein